MGRELLEPRLELERLLELPVLRGLIREPVLPPEPVVRPGVVRLPVVPLVPTVAEPPIVKLPSTAIISSESAYLILTISYSSSNL